MSTEKGKALSVEEAQEKLIAAKEKMVEAKDALVAFNKANGLKKGEDASNHEDAKIAKSWKKLKETLDDRAKRVEKYQALTKGAKKTGQAPKAAKYNYPADVTSGDDKKKYRSLVRQKSRKLGITTDEYLANPAKYEKELKATPAATPGKKPKAKAETEEAPAKKKKVETKETPAPPKKKKKVEAPAEAPAED